MLIPLTNITYDIHEAIDYYETLKRDHSDLMWTKDEMTDYLSPEEMVITSNNNKNLDTQYQMFLAAVDYKEPFTSWTKEKCLEVSNNRFREMTKGVKMWNIKYYDNGVAHPKLDRQQELQFGIAKKIIDIFPEVDVFELLVNPVGTKYNRHTDDSDSIRIIIPIISDQGAVWHFDDADNVTQYPGNAYLLLKEFPHATDVFGPNKRVSMHFLIDAKHRDWVQSLKLHI